MLATVVNATYLKAALLRLSGNIATTEIYQSANLFSLTFAPRAATRFFYALIDRSPVHLLTVLQVNK
jgi:hypothetical protein